jgi:hypothetical protein
MTQLGRVCTQGPCVYSLQFHPAVSSSAVSTVRSQLNHRSGTAQFVFVALRYFGLWTRTGQDFVLTWDLLRGTDPPQSILINTPQHSHCQSDCQVLALPFQEELDSMATTSSTELPASETTSLNFCPIMEGRVDFSPGKHKRETVRLTVTVVKAVWCQDHVQGC